MQGERAHVFSAMASLSIRPPATPRELLDRSTSLRVTLLLSTLLNASAVCNTNWLGCVMLLFMLWEAMLLLRKATYFCQNVRASCFCAKQELFVRTCQQAVSSSVSNAESSTQGFECILLWLNRAMLGMHRPIEMSCAPVAQLRLQKGSVVPK